MVGSSAQSIDEWWMSAFAGLAIALTVWAFNLLGDALNDALNPRAGEVA